MEELKTRTAPPLHQRSSARAATGRLSFAAAFLRHEYMEWASVLRRTLTSVLAHDCLNLAQSTAYSAIVALFPTLIVAAAVIGLIPDTAPLRAQLAGFFDRILPPVVSPLLDAYFQNTPKNTHSIRALVSAAVVSFLGASNVVVTLMEGIRRAANLPTNCWTFWQRRRRSFELVPLSLVPLTVASLLVVFGHTVTVWIEANIFAGGRPWIFAVALLVRWVVAFAASVGLIAMVYHLGTPERRIGLSLQSLYVQEAAGDQHSILQPGAWIPVLPGAVLATVLWFISTLIFGWYVTKFANYSEVYGSLGAGIALLFWLYLVSLSVLFGAEFNLQIHPRTAGALSTLAHQAQ